MGFLQWAADNADHYLITLDGNNSVYVMGVMNMLSPDATNVNTGPSIDAPIPRLERFKAGDLPRTANISILACPSSDASKLAICKFEPITNLKFPLTLPVSVNCDHLWHLGYFFNDTQHPRPNWRGFMQSVTFGPHPPPAKITMLPIIDLNPIDCNCIYSVLEYVIEQAKLLKLDVPCITFDQPLWQKAVDIAMMQSLNVVCRLGGFHLLMSFLGSIGSLTSGSGLEDALECCYGSNKIAHIMCGSCHSRSLSCRICFSYSSFAVCSR